jgi:hypothetical protein
MKTITKRAGLLATLSLGLCIASCKKSDVTEVSPQFNANDSISTKAKTDNTEHANVQFINASFGSGPVSLYINGNKNGKGQTGYGKLSGYWPETPSFYRIPVVIKTASGDTLQNMSSGLFANHYYSVFLTGQKANNNLRTLFFDDNLPTTAPQPGNVRIRFINAAQSSPLVDLVINNRAVITRQGFTGHTNYIEIPAGAANIKINVWATTTTVAALDAAKLESGKTYTVYAKEDMKDNKVVIVGDMFEM